MHQRPIFSKCPPASNQATRSRPSGRGASEWTRRWARPSGGPRPTGRGRGLRAGPQRKGEGDRPTMTILKAKETLHRHSRSKSCWKTRWKVQRLSKPGWGRDNWGWTCVGYLRPSGGFIVSGGLILGRNTQTAGTKRTKIVHVFCAQSPKMTSVFLKPNIK